MHSAKICSVESSLAKLDSPNSEIGGSKISRTSGKSSETTTADPDDWRIPLIHYLKKPNHITNRKVQWQGLKYVILDNTLYRRTIDGLLLKCLGLDQSKIAIGRFMKAFVVPISQHTR
jgi:hypothetical protein